MKVAASETERADTGATRMSGLRHPRAFLSRGVEGTPAREKVVDGFLHLDGRRDDLVVESENRLDEPGRAGGRLGVADLRLDRPEGAPRSVGFRLTEDVDETVQLGPISDARACAMRLDELDGGGRAVSESVGFPQRASLAVGTRRVDRVSLAVARARYRADHRVDPIPVSLRIRQTLENHDAESLAENRAVSVRIEGSCVARRRERGCLRETHVHEDVVEGIDAPRDDHIAASLCELEHAQVNRAEGACAGGVDDAVRSAEIETIRDATGNDVAEKTREGALLPADVAFGDARDDILGELSRHAGFLQGASPDRMTQPRPERNDELERAGYPEDDAHAAAIVFLLRTIAGVLERPLCGDEGKKLCRVGRLDRVRRDPELHWIEVHGRDEPAATRVRPVRRCLIFVEVVFRLPMRRWNLGDGVHSALEVGPEPSHPRGLREETFHADDRDRDLAGVFHGGSDVDACGCRGLLELRERNRFA